MTDLETSPDTTTHIRAAITSILNHYDDALTPAVRGTGSHATRSVDAPLPVSAHILDTRATTRATMASWCLLVIQERDLRTEGLSGLDVPAMADLLTRHSPWLAAHEAGDVALDELAGCARALAGITTPHPRGWMPLGPCPLTTETGDERLEPCNGTIRAYPTCDPYCDTCLTTGDRDYWERAMFGEPLLANLITAADLITVIHTRFGRTYAEPTIRKWASRGEITAVCTDRSGRALYDRVDVVYILSGRAVV